MIRIYDAAVNLIVNMLGEGFPELFMFGVLAFVTSPLWY